MGEQRRLDRLYGFELAAEPVLRKPSQTQLNDASTLPRLYLILVSRTSLKPAALSNFGPSQHYLIIQLR